MKNRISITILLMLCINISWGQKLPGWDKAGSDLKTNQSKLSDFLGMYGFTSIEGFELSQKHDPFKTYSYHANNSLYKYMWEPDLITYSFLGVAPETADGGKYTFTLSVSYSRSKFEGDYGRVLSQYEFYSLGGAVYEYEGKDLNNAVLQKCLFDYTKTFGDLHVPGKYQFTRIDSIAYTRNENTTNSKSAQEYFVKMLGEGAYEWNEYEYRGVADLEVEYVMVVDAVNGAWGATHLSRKSEPIVTNERENPNYPAVNLAKKVGVEAVYQKYSKVEIPLDSYRYLMDICRLIEASLNLSKEEFANIKIIKELFEGTEGKEAMDEIFRLKEITEKYYLTIDELAVSDHYGRGVKNEKYQGNTIKIKFRCNRELSTEELKKTKSDGVSKEVRNVIKYPAQGYFVLSIELENPGGRLQVISSDLNNELKLKNGGYNTKHPLD